MHEFLILENKKFLSTKLAARLAGYTSDYVGQLYRLGKVEGRMVGRSLYVSEDSLIAHKRKSSPTSVIKSVDTLSTVVSTGPALESIESFARTLAGFPTVQPVQVSASSVSVSESNHVSESLRKQENSIKFVSSSLHASTVHTNTLHTANHQTKQVAAKRQDNTIPSKGFIPKFKTRKPTYTHISKLAFEQLVATLLVVAFTASSLYIPHTAPIRNALESASTQIAHVTNQTSEAYGSLAKELVNEARETSGEVAATVNGSLKNVLPADQSLFASVWSAVKPFMPQGISSLAENVGNSLLTFFFKDEPTVILVDAVVTPSPQVTGAPYPTATPVFVARGNTTTTQLVTKYATTTVYENPTIVIKGVTEESLDKKLNEFKSELLARDYAELQHTFDSIARMNLGSGSSDGGGATTFSTDGLTITNSSFSGTTGTFSGNVAAGSLTVTGSGTFGSSLDAGTTTLTNLAVTNTSTSTFVGSVETGDLFVNGNTQIAGLLNCDTIDTDALGNLICGTDAGAGGGISSLNGLNTAGQTFATSSDTNIGLSVSSAGTTHTFTTTWNGTLAASRGGTGLGSVIANQLLVGNPGGTGWTQMSTSSLGLLTTNIAEGSNLYFTNARADARALSVLTSTTTLPNLTTLTGLTNASSTLFTADKIWTTDLFASGKIGIGTTSPLQTLDMAAGGVYGYAGLPVITASTSLNNYFFGNTNAYLTTTGTDNTAVGASALSSNTFGTANSAFGSSVLSSNTGGSYNVGLGYWTLAANTTGSRNVGIGPNSLGSNTTGSNNVGIGNTVLYSNTTGGNNIGIGNSVLLSNSTGGENIGIGDSVLNSNTTGAENVGIGDQVLVSNTTGISNVGIGTSALISNTIGNANLGLGAFALYGGTSVSSSTATGYGALRNSTGSLNTALGFQSGLNLTSGSNNIVIGANVSLPSNTSSNQLNIGNILFGTGVYNGGATNAVSSAAVSGGKIGIGTTSPFAKLSVNGDGFFGGNVRATNITATGTIDVATGGAYTYNGQDVIQASTTLKNFFFGGSGNLTMTGSKNTGVGYQAIKSNTTGLFNSGIGYQALFSNTTGDLNTANGSQALFSNTTGSYNTANGGSLVFNTTGSYNTANGANALVLNSTGSGLTASGYKALYSNTAASSTAVGYEAGMTNTTGTYNTFLGYGADVSSGALTNATAIGTNAKVATSNSLVLGGTGTYAVNVGIGTTSPFAKLSVNGDGFFGGDLRVTNITATGTLAVTGTGTSTFAGGIALTGGCVTVNGTCLGTGSGSGSSFAYPFPSNATSTKLTFSGGLLSLASTTIGDGTQSGGLTISGGATTTGNLLVSGNIAIGNPVTGGAGVTSSGTKSFAGGFATTLGIIQSTGWGSFAYGRAREGTITASNDGAFAMGSTYDGGTFADITASGRASFAFGTNVSSTNDLSMSFGRNFSNTFENTFQVGFSSTPTLTVNVDGVGIGTTSPFAKLSVNGDGFFGGGLRATSFTATSTTGTSTFAGVLSVGSTTPFSGTLFSVGTSTPNLFVSKINGKVGFGTSNPLQTLDVAEGGTYGYNGKILAQASTVLKITFSVKRET